MYRNLRRPQFQAFKKALSILLAGVFSFTMVMPPAYAQGIISLPVPGSMIGLSPSFHPALIRGVTVHPDNPFEFDFLLDAAQSGLKGQELEDESTRLIKYFLTALTVPEDDMWVNLSPYEKDKIVPEKFGITEMGRDLLAQDYLLKQLTASLIYPEDELGQKFWDKVYAKAYKQFGTTNIPINTFNKVWILPDKASVYEDGNSAYILKSNLKVMLDADYVAVSQGHKDTRTQEKTGDLVTGDVVTYQQNDVATQIMREIIVPELEREVNEGKNFAQLRQIYHSLILAAWYKKRLRDSILSSVYADQNKVAGVDIEDKEAKDKIYQQYLDAFKKGVYNYIKEDYDPYMETELPRKYFSGGFAATNFSTTNLNILNQDSTDLASESRDADALAQPFTLSANIVPVEEQGPRILITDNMLTNHRDPVVVKPGDPKGIFRRLYEDDGKTIGYIVDITEYVSQTVLKNGTTQVSFPIPGGQWGKQENMKSGGKNLTRLEYVVIKEKGKVVKVTFIGYRNDEAGNEVRLGRGDWEWSDEAQRFEYKKNRHPSEERVIELYGKKFKDVEETVDITGSLAKNLLEHGRINISFPLPNGKTWGTGSVQALKIGIKLEKIEIIVRKNKYGRVSDVTFVGYKKKNGKTVETARSDWKWNGKRYVHQKEADPTVKRLKEIYDPENKEKKVTVDLSEYLGEKYVSDGSLKPQFPLPNGEQIGRGKRFFVRTGRRILTKLEVVIHKEDGVVKSFTFISYRKNEKGEEVKHREAVWFWDGEKLTYQEEEKDETEELLKKLYQPEEVFEQRVVDVTEYVGEPLLRLGYLRQSLPLPNGKTWGASMDRGDSAYMYLGLELSRAEVVLKKKDGTVTGLELIGYKKDDAEKEHEHSRSEWLWNGEKFVVQKEDHPQRVAIVDFYNRETEDDEPIQETFDVSDYLGEHYLSAGMIKASFPLPNGKKWKKEQHLRLGNSLQKIEATVTKDTQDVKMISFRAIGQDGITRESFWSWNVFSQRFDYLYLLSDQGTQEQYDQNGVLTGYALMQMRMERGLSQRDAAQMLNVGERRIRNIESGISEDYDVRFRKRLTAIYGDIKAGDDSLGDDFLFPQDISQLLTPEEERVLLKSIAAKRLGDKKDENGRYSYTKTADAEIQRLIMANKAFIITLAVRYRHLHKQKRVDMDELIQVGLVGLTEGFYRTDLERTIKNRRKFLSYASYYALKAIQNRLGYNSTRKTVKKDPKLFNDFENDEGSYALKVLSPDEEKAPIRDNIDDVEEMQFIEKFLREYWADSRIGEIVARRFLRETVGEKQDTLDEIGADMGIGRERVRQLQEEGLNTLRDLLTQWMVRTGKNLENYTITEALSEIMHDGFAKRVEVRQTASDLSSESVDMLQAQLVSYHERDVLDANFYRTIERLLAAGEAELARDGLILRMSQRMVALLIESSRLRGDGFESEKFEQRVFTLSGFVEPFMEKYSEGLISPIDAGKVSDIIEAARLVFGGLEKKDFEQADALDMLDDPDVQDTITRIHQHSMELIMMGRMLVPVLKEWDEFILTETDLHDLIHQMAVFLMEKHNVGLLTDLDVSVSKIQAFQDHTLGLVFLLEELINNAVFYGRDASIKTQRLSGDRVKITVENKGRLTRSQEHLYDWFVQEHGLGMGLALVQLVVKFYGGELSIEQLTLEGEDVVRAEVILPISEKSRDPSKPLGIAVEIDPVTKEYYADMIRNKPDQFVSVMERALKRKAAEVRVYGVNNTRYGNDFDLKERKSGQPISIYNPFEIIFEDGTELEFYFETSTEPKALVSVVAEEGVAQMFADVLVQFGIDDFMENYDIDGTPASEYDLSGEALRVVSQWDLEKAKEIVWEELIRDPGQPKDSTNLNEVVYRQNQRSIRREIINLLTDMAAGELGQNDLSEFRRRLERINTIALLGEDGESYYFPPSSSIFSQRDEQAEHIKKIAGKLRIHENQAGTKFEILFNALQEFVQVEPGQASPEELIDTIVYFYEEWIRNLGVFVTGNNSVGMNFVNTMLRLHGYNGIPHRRMDFANLVSEDLDAVPALLREEFKKTNPSVVMTSESAAVQDLSGEADMEQARRWREEIVWALPEADTDTEFQSAYQTWKIWFEKLSLAFDTNPVERNPDRILESFESQQWLVDQLNQEWKEKGFDQQFGSLLLKIQHLRFYFEKDRDKDLRMRRALLDLTKNLGDDTDYALALAWQIVDIVTHLRQIGIHRDLEDDIFHDNEYLVELAGRFDEVLAWKNERPDLWERVLPSQAGYQAREDRQVKLGDFILWAYRILLDPTIHNTDFLASHGDYLDRTRWAAKERWNSDAQASMREYVQKILSAGTHIDPRSKRVLVGELLAMTETDWNQKNLRDPDVFFMGREDDFTKILRELILDVLLGRRDPFVVAEPLVAIALKDDLLFSERSRSDDFWSFAKEPLVNSPIAHTLRVRGEGRSFFAQVYTPEFLDQVFSGAAGTGQDLSSEGEVVKKIVNSAGPMLSKVEQELNLPDDIHVQFERIGQAFQENFIRNVADGSLWVHMELDGAFDFNMKVTLNDRGQIELSDLAIEESNGFIMASVLIEKGYLSQEWVEQIYQKARAYVRKRDKEIKDIINNPDYQLDNILGVWSNSDGNPVIQEILPSNILENRRNKGYEKFDHREGLVWSRITASYFQVVHFIPMRYKLPESDEKDSEPIQSVAADLSSEQVGGIDLNPSNIQLDIQNGQPLPPDINLQQLQNINIQGFTPVIINITPATNLPLIFSQQKPPSSSPTAQNRLPLWAAQRFLARN